MMKSKFAARALAALAIGAALAALDWAAPGWAAATRSHAATFGAAPFSTAHLLPGDDFDLSAVDLSAPAAQVAALTFDDGPHVNDMQIMEILRRHHAKATFFYIGRNVGREEAVARAVAGSENEVGNHSLTHPMMTELSPAEQIRNLAGANAKLAQIGAAATWFRPPYGDFDGAVTAEARRLGLKTVLWTVDSRDWKGGGAAVIGRRVASRLGPGAVVLLHSTKTESVEALPEILAEGERRGLRFVTLSEWRAAMTAAASGRRVGE